MVNLQMSEKEEQLRLYDVNVQNIDKQQGVLVNA